MEDPGGLDGSRNEFTVTMESAFDWVIRDAGDDTGSRGEDTAGIENDDMENYDDAPSSGALPAESEDLHLEDAGPERVEEEIIVAQPVADKPSPNSNADESGYRREEMEPDQVSNNDRADDADRRDETGSSSGSSLQDLVVLQDDSPLAEENGSWGRDDDLPPDSGQLEVQIPTLAVSLLEEYSAVLSEVVDYVNNVNTTSKSCEVEFTDGRIETIPINRVTHLENGQYALDQFLQEGYGTMRNERKRKYAADNDYSDAESEPDDASDASNAMELDGDDSDEPVRSHRRSSRRASRTPRVVFSRRRDSRQSDDAVKPSSRASRSLRPRANNPPSYYPDEARDSPKTRAAGSDDDFLPIVSDLAPPRRGRRPMRGRARTLHTRTQSGGGSDIEFEPLRRSSRANKATQHINDDLDSDDEFESVVVKERGAPKVISVREVYEFISPDSPFGASHMQRCHTCAGSKQKGQLLYCQGCSMTFHKACIGYRSAREHLVTKVGEESFVLQCKFCIGIYTARDDISPKYDMCQQCRKPGAACSPFSKKVTSRQEEKLREENEGIDPIAPVKPELINSEVNVLFRCKDCHRAWHMDHLPSTDGVQSDVVGSSAKTWRCAACDSAGHKIHRLVAWRPITPYVPAKGKQPPAWKDVSEDDKEYLVKWEAKSYNHCTWVPGAWVYGVTAGVMRKAFGKRDLELSLLKPDTKDAIPDEFLAPDIIFVAKMESTAPVAKSKEDMVQNISHVRRIFVKFQGLGYDDVVWHAPPTPDTDVLYRAFVEAYGEYVNGKYFEQETQTAIRTRVETFKDKDFEELSVQPNGIRRGKLMGYQLEGLNWLLANYHHGRSVVLADEMGLGKTVQVVSLVTSLVQDKPKCWPFLIVVPNATCPNWRREFRQWAPDLRVVAYHGGREPQELTYRYELFPEHGSSMRAHVVIMSYDSAQDPRTSTLFKSVKWAGLVVDEGQRLKNDQNLLYQALRGMKIPFRLLLTGTPLQNNKRELFNLIQFIDNTQNAAALDEQFEILDKETLPQLHDKIRPYFLRRTKAGVLKFLPPMAQIIVPVTMTVVQEKLAKSIMSKNPELIKAIFADSKLKMKDRGSLNNIMMQLRKCLCHPFMYSDNIEEKHHDPVVMHQNLVEASAKLLLLDIMLPKLKERGHRVLIFSQFLNQLDIIEDFLSGIGYEYRRLDGSMSSLEKQRRIDAFNAPDSPLFAFLLSTRAGGVGINLATADTVIILDPDFNPHQDLQALSRAHRIGQKNKVLCFQLMTKDSVEERIMQIGRSKMALDHALIETMDDDELEGADLESILKHGAAALFSDDHQRTKIEYNSAMIDSLLDRSQIEQASIEENPNKEAPFAHARVWDSDKVGFDNLPSAEAEAPIPINSGMWDKIIAQREEEARRKAEANREILGRGGRRRTKINYTSKGGDKLQDDDPAAASDTDEFAGGDSSSESEDELALKEAEADPSDRQLTDQTNKGQRPYPAAVERIRVTAYPSRPRGTNKELYTKQAPPSNDGQPENSAQRNGADAQRRSADWRAGHAPGMKQMVFSLSGQPPPAPFFEPDPFLHYVSRLASEKDIRMAIDRVTHDGHELHAAKQMRLYALHERLRQTYK